MKVYLSLREVVVEMHGRGYTDDFELNADGIYWVQHKLVLKPEEFLIIECHSFLGPQRDGLMIFGIVSPRFLVKGLLINHYHTPLSMYNLVMIEKLEELISLANCSAMDISEYHGAS